MSRKSKPCYECEHKRNVPGNAHILCVNPDPNMTGDEHGKSNGWFFYPDLFDPVWITKECDNFRAKDDSVSDTVNACKPLT